MKTMVCVTVDAPDDATHYTGDLLDEPTWWKHSINSTGFVQNWVYWSRARKEWMISGPHAPTLPQRTREGE